MNSQPLPKYERPAAKFIVSPSLASLIAATAQAVAFAVDSAFYPNCDSNTITHVSGETPLNEVVLHGDAPDSAAGEIAGNQAITLGELTAAEILIGSTSLRLADGRLVEILIEHRASFLPVPTP